MQITIERTATKEDFIKTLRSGKYEQLQDGRMFDGTGKVCALMVWHILNGDGGITSPVGDTTIFGMPSQFANHIAELNDSGYSFPEIADVIENHISW